MTNRGVGDGPAQHAPASDAGSSAVVAAQLDILRLAFGSRLSEDQVRAVRRRLAANLELAAPLYRCSLANGDEPDFVFRAFRQEG